MDLLREGVEGLRRRERDRARTRRTHVGRGGSWRSLAALRSSNALTLICDKCEALVDYGAMHRAIVKQRGKPASYQPGDGCAGLGCAKRFRRERFTGKQTEYMASLAKQKRVIIEWPVDTDDTNFKTKSEAPISFVELGERVSPGEQDHY